MFTGIVQDVGRVATLQGLGGDLRLRIVTVIDASRMTLGSSVAVNGACLTVAELAAQGFWADVSRETLQVTTLGALREGDAVNIEPALRAGDALGGHIVSGHVDGIAEVLSVAADARSTRLVIAAPQALRRYIVTKGSVTLDGVSLTVNENEAASFGVNLVPHTLQVTTFGRIAAGARVNLEVDALARYVERLLPGLPEGPGRVEWSA